MALAKNNTILIVTMKLDPHADAVIDELSLMGWQVFRLNSEDLLSTYTFSLTQHLGAADGVIADSLGRSVSFDKIHAAYYRKPKAVRPHSQLLDQGAASFSAQEGEELLRSIYTHPELKWVNDPYSIRRAQIKLPQLRIAADVGFQIPRTIITNDTHQARLFCESCSYDVVCKSLLTTTIASDQGTLHTYTHRLTRAEIDRHIESVRYAPTLIQQWVPKASEIRATVIGGKVFACEIDSQAVPEASVDWRVVDPHTIPHRAVDLPPDINRALVSFLHRYDLQFGAIDLIRTPDNDYIFLENNPNGQWYWIEILTGMRMAKAMAELLTSDSAGLTFALS